MHAINIDADGKTETVSTTNPLIGSTDRDTMNNVASVLDYVGSLEHSNETTEDDTDTCNYGRWLLYQTLVRALRAGQSV